MWVIYRSMSWEQILGRGTENEAYCRTFGVTRRKQLYGNITCLKIISVYDVLISFNMFTWGVAGTVRIPQQVFVHGFPACGLWHIHESSDIYFSSVVMSQFNLHTVRTACSYLHSRPPRDRLIPKHIKRGRGRRRLAWILWCTAESLGRERKSRYFRGAANIFSFLSPELIWQLAVKWDESHSGGCVSSYLWC